MGRHERPHPLILPFQSPKTDPDRCHANWNPRWTGLLYLEEFCREREGREKTVQFIYCVCGVFVGL